jgi:TonB family protein
MRRRRRHQWGPSALVGSFAISLLIHLAAGVPLLDLVNDYLAAARHGADKPVRVVRLSADQWQKNRTTSSKRQRLPAADSPASAAFGDPAKKEEEKKKEPPKEEKLRGQVVEVPPTADDSPNPEAKYLSKYNTHVDKESTARPEERDRSLKRVTNKLQTKELQGRPEDAVPTPGITVKGDDVDVDRAGDKGKGDEKGAKQFVLEVPDLKQSDGVQLKLSDASSSRSQRVTNRAGTDALEGNSDRLRLEMGDGLDAGGGANGGKRGKADGADQAVPNLAALVPTIGTIARISGSPSNDHVDGVPEGDGTFLNTKEFKYATFFYRVRDSVSAHWEDLVANEYRRRDPTGNIYGVRDRSTTLHIQLSPDGHLDQVRIEQTSGVEFLDNVAIQAFRMAEPFPNPPPGLIEEDGSIKFNFGFVVTMRSRGPFNLFQ